MEAKGFKDTEYYNRLKYKLEMLAQGKAVKRDVTLECIAAAGALMAAWTVFDGGRYHSTEEMIKTTQETVNRWKLEGLK